jgi:predicted Rossmann fold nucleotide-binding protein DprA/Smf involved in DNA uptake
VLGLKNAKKARNIPKGSNQQQQVIIDLIASGKCEGEDLMQLCKLSISDYNKVMTMLEITGKIRALGANQWTLI